MLAHFFRSLFTIAKNDTVSLFPAEKRIVCFGNFVSASRRTYDWRARIIFEFESIWSVAVRYLYLCTLYLFNVYTFFLFLVLFNIGTVYLGWVLLDLCRDWEPLWDFTLWILGFFLAIQFVRFLGSMICLSKYSLWFLAHVELDYAYRFDGSVWVLRWWFIFWYYPYWFSYLSSFLWGERLWGWLEDLCWNVIISFCEAGFEIFLVHM